MKNIIIKIYCIALCIVTVFCFASCKTENPSSPTVERPSSTVERPSSTVESSSSTVEKLSPIADLLQAIKKNPTKYNNKSVSLKGTIYKKDGITLLLDFHDDIDFELTGGVQERYEAQRHPSIEVILLDNIQSYVVESWDYVKITGTIKITSEKIYLANCECTIILTKDERR